jgi:hypothetical protein
MKTANQIPGLPQKTRQFFASGLRRWRAVMSEVRPVGGFVGFDYIWLF